MKATLLIVIWTTALVLASVAVGLSFRSSPTLSPKSEEPKSLKPMPVAAEVDLAPVVMTVPPIVIVGRAPPHPVIAKREPPIAGAMSLEEMRCSDWRPLAMGAGSVRACEPSWPDASRAMAPGRHPF